LSDNEPVLAAAASPVPADGDNLLTFMANRLSASFTELNCGNFGLTNPVTVSVNGDGVATSASFDTTEQTATSGSVSASAP